MRVQKLMSRRVTTCSPQDTLEHAAKLMWDNDCGCVPVVEGNGTLRLASIITDRDICMSAMFQGKPLHELRVGEAMAGNVLVCKPSDLVSDAERKMQEEQIRRLPVVDDDGVLVGILSMADIARESAKSQFSQRPEIPVSEVATTLAAICRPAGDRLAA